MAAITLKNICKTYPNNVQAVCDFNLSVADGEFIVLVGPSGCGKTSTLRMIAGLEDATSGEIYFNDKKVNGLLPKDRDTSMVFQNYTLFPYMTIFNNIAFPLRIKRCKKDYISRQVEQVSTMLNIRHLLPRKPKQLSGGEKQRTALARAIVKEPQVFLFDEPLCNLDSDLRASLRNEISLVHQKLKTTTIYVTHDQIEAMTLGERIVIMKDGVIKQTGKPLEVYNKPNSLFAASSTGRINSLKGRLVRRNGTIDFIPAATSSASPLFSIAKNKHIHAFANWSPYAGKTIDMAIRPEHIKIDRDTPQEENDKYLIISAVNRFCEHQGHTSYASFAIPGDDAPHSKIVAADTDNINLSTGDKAYLKLDISKILLFT